MLMITTQVGAPECDFETCGPTCRGLGKGVDGSLEFSGLLETSVLANYRAGLLLEEIKTFLRSR